MDSPILQCTTRAVYPSNTRLCDTRGKSTDPRILQCTTRVVYRSNTRLSNTRGKVWTLLFYNVPLVQYAAPILDFLKLGEKVWTLLFYNVPLVQYTPPILDFVN